MYYRTIVQSFKNQSQWVSVWFSQHDVKVMTGSAETVLKEQNLRKAFQTCVSYALEFCFYKTVSLNGKTKLKLWSQAGVLIKC